MKKIIVVLMAVLVLAGCAPKGKTQGNIEITHKLGTTNVTLNPDKVVIFDMGILDIYQKFELPVGAVAKASLPKSLDAYNDEAVMDAGTLFEPNLEALAEYGPELIIVSGRASKHYDELSKIAPTIYMGRDSSDAGLLESVATNIDTLSKIYTDTDFKDAMKPLNDAVTNLATKAKASNLSTMFIMANGDEAKSFGAKSRYDHVFNEFGFTPVDHELDPSTHGASVSFELINALQPEIMIVMDRAAVTGGKTLAKTLMDNDYVNNTPAAKNNRIIYVNPESWYLTEGGYQAILDMVNELTPLFS
ncbi:ABC transporter substrate-binding protein [Erysipelothrix sp. HDW6B]|uniref:siderophore ABC transporter substrate-binding protein n=1 Tax=Erysipelothrix sp. HDW6B TaxID=2714929 RepID=UPI001408952E|nr:ABC transporter substrate-binding protein [Erysipelothrix sp. HDW6B]QIK87099.1 ABC transporter substrate-binding protein [Erysipelothrix sp. HDW6B]